MAVVDEYVDKVIDLTYLTHTLASNRPLVEWEHFKSEHPPGSKVVGTVTRAEPFGVFLDLGVPFDAVLLVPYIAPIGTRKSFPDDYPKVGEELEVFIRHYGDQIAPEGVGKIALTQDLNSLWI